MSVKDILYNAGVLIATSSAKAKKSSFRALSEAGIDPWEAKDHPRETALSFGVVG